MENGPNLQSRYNYRLLDEGQVKLIHNAAVNVLETVGVRVDHSEAYDMLIKAGCQAAKENQILIPENVVNQCLKTVPSSIILYDQLGNKKMELEGRKNHFGLGTDLIHTVDLKTEEMRLTTYQDVINAALVSDACSNIDFIASFGLPCDIHKNLSYLESVKALIYNSSKPIFFTAAGRSPNVSGL